MGGPRCQLTGEQKQQVSGSVARDIDDWMFHFERQVGPRLKAMFDSNLEKLPPALAARLQRLRSSESAPADPSRAKPRSKDD